jgi:hypothetical protein
MRGGRPGARAVAGVVVVLSIAACGSTGDATRTRAATTPGIANVPTATARAAKAKPAGPIGVPKGWPARLTIGLSDVEDGAATLRERAPFGVRWAYLSGGAGGPGTWQRWRQGNGSYATAFVADSASNGQVPFLSYYVLQQTEGADHLSHERDKVVAGLRDPSVLRPVVADLTVALRRMQEGGARLAVLQVEPDLWGYAQQRYGEDAARVPVAVRASGGALAKGLRNDLRGFATLVTRIRNRYARSVRLAFPVSIWGTNKDIVGSKPDEDELRAMIGRTTRFYRSLGRPFDLLTFEYANRTSGYARIVDGVPADQVEWSSADYARHLRYVRGVIAGTRRAGVLWQVPVGNDVMAASDDTKGHYRDDKVQRLLGNRGRPLLRSMRASGVIGVLFGSAFPNDTCACDAQKDGVTGKEARDGRRAALSADDDGGYLVEQVKRYVRGGALRNTGVPRR